jgi:hypothetical protein
VVLSAQYIHQIRMVQRKWSDPDQFEGVLALVGRQLSMIADGRCGRRDKGQGAILNLDRLEALTEEVAVLYGLIDPGPPTRPSRRYKRSEARTTGRVGQRSFGSPPGRNLGRAFPRARLHFAQKTNPAVLLAEPSSTAGMAPLRPSWAWPITNRTSARPRPRGPLRKSAEKATPSESRLPGEFCGKTEATALDAIPPKVASKSPLQPRALLGGRRVQDRPLARSLPDKSGASSCSSVQI